MSRTKIWSRYQHTISIVRSWVSNPCQCSGHYHPHGESYEEVLTKPRIYTFLRKRTQFFPNRALFTTKYGNWVPFPTLKPIHRYCKFTQNHLIRQAYVTYKCENKPTPDLPTLVGVIALSTCIVNSTLPASSWALYAGLLKFTWPLKQQNMCAHVNNRETEHPQVVIISSTTNWLMYCDIFSQFS